MQSNVNELRDSYIKLQVLNDMNLKLYEELLVVLDKLDGDK